ncbi:MAG: tRNA lysidine(34) synthetase TilS [Bacteroidales bacterium]|nr:tRNA lysidine(34) synthetase TilS [Bacteroidales bacterium]
MLLQPFNNFIAANQLFSIESRILLAVSGGIDSVVMAELFYRAKFAFGIAHCNFGLRGTESDNDEHFVTELASKYNVPCYIQKFDTNGYAHEKGISIQMAARELRYEWFETIRKKEIFDFIATAHHLDDQIETFFINLIRGTGISGLHGIPVRNGNIIRPLLFAYRKQIAEFAFANNIQYHNDSSNASTKYLRNKIRHDLLPAITTMNPDFSANLTATIGRIRDMELIANKTISDWRNKVMKEEGQNFIINVPAFLHSEPLDTLAWELLTPFGFNKNQVINIVHLIEKGSGTQFFSPTHRLIKNRQQLIIQPLPDKEEEKHFLIQDFTLKKTLKCPISLTLKKINDPSYYDIPTSNDTASIDYEKITFPLILRKWDPGDIFYPFGMNQKKKLSDFFIDHKFSLPDKESCWLICSGKEIIWVVGHRPDHRFRITKKTRKILQIKVEP